jgi:hypothetical protein
VTRTGYKTGASYVGNIIKPGVVPTLGGVKLFQRSLANFDLTLGEGWTQEGPRAFVFEGPTVAVSPALSFGPIVDGASYQVAMNITEINGLAPLVSVRLGGIPELVAISAIGIYTFPKVVANATTQLLEFIVALNTNTDKVVIKSLYITRVA